MTAGVVTVPLAEVADVVRGVTFGKSDASDCALPNLMPVLRAGNIGRDLELDRNLVWVPTELVSPRQMLRFDDLVMCASSGSAAVVGKSAPVRRRDWKGTVGAFCFIVRSKSALCSAEFLAFVLRSSSFRNWAQRAAGANIKNIRKSELEEFPVPLPPLHEQRWIVGILNQAVKIERLRARVRELMGEFVPALFVRMFGDPVENPMRWERANLGNLSQVQSGLQVTKKRNAHPIETPYLRVANVLRDRLDLDEIKFMRVTEREFERVQLKLGDLLIVEGHGNASEIGRVGIWDGSINGCIHQNHLIRARPDQSKILSEFACAYLNSSSGREHLLRSGKTTSGLNTITTSNVKSCNIFLPPLDLQRRYTQLVETARSNVAVAESASRTASELSASLMSRLLKDRA